MSSDADAAAEENGTKSNIPFLCRTVLIIIIIGVAARLIIGFFLTFVYDIFHWGVVTQNINSGNGLYELTGYFYTPVWGYFLGVSAFFQDIFGVAMIGEFDTFFRLPITSIAFNLSIKIMMLISDLIVGYLIFWIIRDITKDGRKAVIGFALWFLCPFVITSGSVVATFDTLSVLMTLLAVVMLRKDRYIESGAMLCMATLMKFFSGFFIFIFIAYIISKNKAGGTANKKLAMFLSAIAVTAFILFLPQLLDGTIADSFSFITSRMSGGLGRNLSVIVGYVALFIYVVAMVVSVILAMRMIRNGDSKELDHMLFDALLIVTAVVFIFPPAPQYVLLLLPFVIFAFLSDRRYITPLILMMIGTTLASVSDGPLNLAAVAAYTDIMDMSSLRHAVDVFVASFHGISIMNVWKAVGLSMHYAGILLVLWVRFGERIKETVRKHRHKENTAQQ